MNLDIPYPSLFWACEAEEGLKFSTNPFDRVNLGYDGLFGPKTMFYHIPPALIEGQAGLVQKLSVPVLDPRSESMGGMVEWVQMGTFLAVIVGFAWVVWMLVRSAGGGGGEKKDKVAEKTQ